MFRMLHHTYRNTHFNSLAPQIRATTNFDRGHYDPANPPGINLTYHPHDHDFFELVIVNAGTGYHVLGQDRFPVQRGDVFCIPPGNSHYFVEVEGLKIYNILFVPELIKDLGETFSGMPGFLPLFFWEPHLRGRQGFRAHLRVMPMHWPRIFTLAEQIIDEERRRSAAFTLMQKCLFSELSIQLLRLYQDQTNQDVLGLLRLSPLLEEVQVHYAENWTLERMSQMIFMSVSSLRRAFIQCTGRSPMDYLIQVRIDRSLRLLANPNVNIGDVSEAVGFRDSNYFTRCFKQRLGVSPRQWRRT